jgi:hypothetical protein
MSRVSILGQFTMALICSILFMARFFSMEEKREICKGEIGFHFLEAHMSSESVYLKEI